MKNTDLISRKYVVRELLKERENFPAMVAERYSLGVKLPHRFNQAMRGGIRKALRIAETAPTVDAEPVRHGRWIPSTVKNILHFKCSECSEYIEAVWMANFDYVFCPNCGAKMDAEVEG